MSDERRRAMSAAMQHKSGRHAEHTSEQNPRPRPPTVSPPPRPAPPRHCISERIPEGAIVLAFPEAFLPAAWAFWFCSSVTWTAE